MYSDADAFKSVGLLYPVRMYRIYHAHAMHVFKPSGRVAICW